jgi:uncharacterized delta-60 repeat protein
MTVPRFRVALALGAALCLFMVMPLSATAAPGELDPSFGTGGRARTEVAAGSGAVAVALQADGKIVTAGQCVVEVDTWGFCLTRHTVDGGLDASFDGDGKVTTTIGTDGLGHGRGFAYAVAIQADGKIVVAGQCGVVPGLDGFCLARYNDDGGLDTSFDGDGRVLTLMGTAGSVQGIANAVAIQSDGKIVAAGWCQAVGSGFGSLCLARYTSDGSLDPLFGPADNRLFNFAFSGSPPKAIVLQADGKIVVAGGCGGPTQLCLVRYQNCFLVPGESCVDGGNIAGRLDGSFGSSGIVATTLGEYATDYLAVEAAIQAEGKIVAGVGCVTPTGIEFCLARYAGDGSLDPTFGTGGILETPIGDGDAYVAGLVIQGDGKIVAAGGCVTVVSGTTSCLARFESDGGFDSSFGVDGEVIGDPLIDGPLTGLVLQDDGKLVTAGACHPPLAFGFCLARYHGVTNVVSPPIGIALTPAKPTMANGTHQQFTATGTYADGSTADLTTEVTWASATPAVATISAGGLAHALAPGATTISAMLGPVSGDTVLTVALTPQTITFDPLADKTYGDPDFAVSASASSSLAVSFGASGNCTSSETIVHITGAGSCTITASQPGEASYAAAPSVSRTFSIGKASQTITFGALANKRLGDPDFAVAASASSGLAVAFSARGTCTVAGARVHLTGAGSCTITASQAGNANYNAAPAVSRTFSIARRAQRCTVPRVIGKPLAIARSMLAKGHCRTGVVTRVYSRTRRRGVVIGQSRRPGRVLPANSKVNLVVSRGRSR